VCSLQAQRRHHIQQQQQQQQQKQQQNSAMRQWTAGNTFTPCSLQTTTACQSL
jgi:hypothetical protein